MPDLKTCERCGRGGLTPAQGSEEARLLRRSERGMCASCAVTRFLQCDETPLREILAARGPEILLAPHVREQFARLLASGQSDCVPSEIDWEGVVANWNLPWPAKGGRRG